MVVDPRASSCLISVAVAAMHPPGAGCDASDGSAVAGQLEGELQLVRQLDEVHLGLVAEVRRELLHQHTDTVQGVLVLREALRQDDQPCVAPGLVAGVSPLLERTLPAAAPAVSGRATRTSSDHEGPSAVRALQLTFVPLLAHPITISSQ